MGVPGLPGHRAVLATVDKDYHQALPAQSSTR